MATDLSITLPDLDSLRTEAAPVYYRYPQQTQAQPAYIEMDEDGDISVDYSGEIGGAVPSRVWHHRTLRWTIPATLTGAAIAEFLGRDDVQALLDRVYMGHSTQWDGSNHVGRLDAAARDASDTLDRLCSDDWMEPDHAQIWTCAELLSDVVPLDEDGTVTPWMAATSFRLDTERTITAHTDDAGLHSIARALEDEAERNGGTLDDSMYDYLDDLRSTCRTNDATYDA